MVNYYYPNKWIIFVFFEDLSFNQLSGNIFAIFSGFGFAGTIIFLRKQKEGRPIDSIILGNLITLFICIPFFKSGLTNDPIAWAGILYLGVVQLGFTYCLYSIAIKHVSAIDAAIYPVIEPISSPILAYFILGETMTKYSIFGGSIIIIIIMMRAFFKNKN